MDDNYRDWLPPLFEKSAPWHEVVDRRRAEALKPRRTASGFSIASYTNVEEMAKVLETWRETPTADRAYSWSYGRIAREATTEAPAEPVEHVRRYLNGLARDAVSYVGGPAADELHELYSQPTGYIPNLPSALALYRAPTGGQASLAAAKITGADFGTSSARIKAFNRASPRNRVPEFSFLSNEEFARTLGSSADPKKPGF